MNKELYQYVFALIALGDKLTARQRQHLECLNAIMAEEAANLTK